MASKLCAIGSAVTEDLRNLDRPIVFRVPAEQEPVPHAAKRICGCTVEIRIEHQDIIAGRAVPLPNSVY